MPLELDEKLELVGRLWAKQSARGHHYLIGGSKSEKWLVFIDLEAEEGEGQYLLYRERKHGPQQEVAEIGPGGFPFAKPANKRPPGRPRKRKPKVKAPPVEDFDDPLDDLFSNDDDK